MLNLNQFALPTVCERIATGGEMLNVGSALVIVLTALACLRHWIGLSLRRDFAVVSLILMALAAGLGSALYHLDPGPTTLRLDTMPIQLFVMSSFAYILYRMIGFDALVTLLNLAAFILVALLFGMMLPAALLGNGAHYVAPLIAIYILGAGLVIYARMGLNHDAHLTGAAAARSDSVHIPRLKAGWGLLQVGIVFAMALVARSLDMPLCETLPYGTHFIWHLLMAFATGRLLLVIIEFAASEQKALALASR
ncbi:MAG TPA: hypothetical protein PLQ11_10455 [Beijerinckiaceae bacterium]|nr:hypothetical protein [Beijerinckiaceae bacterium]